MNRRWDGFRTDALHVVVLANFAVAQPLYAVLGQGAEFFVARRSDPGDVLLLVLALSAGLPALAILLEAAAGLIARQARTVAHAVLVAALTASLVLQAARDLDALPGYMLLLDAAALAAGLTGLYFRWRPARMALTVLAPAPLLFAGLFLFLTPVARVVFPQEVDALASPAIGRPAPIVLVVFDEFNSTLLMDEHRRIDPVRYPNLAALAGEATWYRAATTVSDATVDAVPAILTGRRPGPSKRLPTAEDHPGNLFTLLGGRYSMVAFESIARLCPDLRCTRERTRSGRAAEVRRLLSDLGVLYLRVILPSDLRTRLPGTARAWKGLAVEAEMEPAALFEQFVASIRRAERPALYFIHVLLPHMPWRYLPSGRAYESHAEAALATDVWERGGEDRREHDEWAMIQGFQRHLLQMGLVDRLVGDLVRRLKDTGIYDKAMLVVTADHGLAFRAGESPRAVSPENAHDIMAVPLLVKLPGQRAGEVTDRDVETIDILPTIADVVHVELPWPVDGRSLLDAARPPRERKEIVRWESRSALAVDAALEGRWQTLSRMLGLFGSGAKPDGLYRLGRYGELVGEPLSVVEARAGDGRVTVALDDPALWDDVDPDDAFLPARVKGRVVVTGPPRGPLDLAVSVNGTIRAVTRTLAWESGTARFSAMLPEAAIRPGTNLVEVFVVTGPPERPVLHRARREAAPTGRLVREPGAGGREVITMAEGRTMPVVPGAVVGWVDQARPGADGLILAGWAVDPKAGALTRGVFVFVDGELEYAGETDAFREDISKLFRNPALRVPGFVIAVPSRALGASADADVRVFALSQDGRASELEYCASCRSKRRR